MFFNRDISWLGFNYRVLAEAEDKNVPLYERLNFMAIFSSNLDEFFRVRYPAIIATDQLNTKLRQKATGNAEERVAEKIQEEINRQLDRFGSILINDILPALKENGIFFYYNYPIRAEHRQQATEICLSQVLSYIQPVFLDPETGIKFQPENNQLYLVVTVKDKEQDMLKHALVNIPSGKTARFFVLPPIDTIDYVIFVDDILRENLSIIFPGWQIESVYSIKFNRDAELNLEDEYNSNLLAKIEKQLKKRDFGTPSRFLYEKGMPRNLQLLLASIFNVKLDDMFEGGRYHHLSDLSKFPSFNKDLHYAKWAMLPHPGITGSGDIFNSVRQKDILLQLPYHSYVPVLGFFNQAAVDPDVTHIYITLYRVAVESSIVNALISAAKNGKKVTAFIELKARFDEANNIKWSRIMKQAGIRLIYGLHDIKVHSKIALVQKKLETETISYAVLSTGNFNEITAKFYTDHVLLTCDIAITSELLQLFKLLQHRDSGLPCQPAKFNTLFVSQYNMVDEFEKLIHKEIKKADRGEPAMIRIKVNNLEEPSFINLLYKAAAANVSIHCIVRSICCMIPGINITVRRIVDRFLEHSRIFIFGADDDLLVIMGSSDLMTRNLLHRIEVCVTVKEEDNKKQLIDYFEMQWADNTKAVQLTPDAQQIKINSEDNTAINARENIYQYLQNKI